MRTATTKILFVDDDPNLLDGLQRAMRRQFPIDTALGGEEALEKIAASGPYALIVADMQMPQMSGLELLRKVQERAPDCVRMMLTGNSDLKTAIAAVNEGRVFRYLTKPCAPPDLAPILAEGLEHYRVRFVEREVLESTLAGAVKVLTEILSLMDPAVFNRSQKLKEYVHGFSAFAGVSSAWEVELAAMLSQVGRVTVPRTVIERVGTGFTLTDAERSLLDNVPEFGARLLANIPRLEYVATIVRYQHKHFDGSGFPADALCEEDIPIGSRILKIFDDVIDFENASISRQDAFIRMQERAGCYDPRILMEAWDWCNRTLDAREQAPMRVVTIDELEPGQVLVDDLRSHEGLLILAANTRLTEMLLAKLQNFRSLDSIDNTLLVYLR